MKYLNNKEIAFFEALQKDYEINKDKSFIEVLFCAGFKSHDEMRNDLNNLFNMSYKKLFNLSDLLFESAQCCYVGKYKEDLELIEQQSEDFNNLLDSLQ